MFCRIKERDKNNLIYFAEIYKIQPAKNKYNGEIIAKEGEKEETLA